MLINILSLVRLEGSPICGIVGVIGDISEAEKKVFKDLLRIDSIRGKHSVGIAYSEMFSGDINVYKEAWRVDDFLEKKEVVDQFKIRPNAIIGHNRHATVGKVNKVNAHPFEFEHVVGVHNGTLRQRYKLDDYRDFEVDSENLYHHMNNNGLQSTVDNMTGAWSLAWFSDGLLNLYRNAERPMSYVFSEDGATVFFASEPYMLHLALSRHGIKYQTVYYTTVDELNMFRLPTSMKEVVEHLEVQEVKPTPPVKKPNNNVSYLPNKQKKTSPVGYPANLAGKRIAFEVVSYKDPHYVEARTVHNGSGKPEEVRIYCQERVNHELRTLLETSVHIFTGLVKKYNEQSDYLLMDMRTISESNSTGNYKGTPAQQDHNGNLITQEELEKAYGDCSWCGSPLQVGETHCVTHEVALCSDCPLQDEVKDLLGEL